MYPRVYFQENRNLEATKEWKLLPLLQSNVESPSNENPIALQIMGIGKDLKLVPFPDEINFILESLMEEYPARHLENIKIMVFVLVFPHNIIFLQIILIIFSGHGVT